MHYPSVQLHRTKNEAAEANFVSIITAAAAADFLSYVQAPLCGVVAGHTVVLFSSSRHPISGVGEQETKSACALCCRELG